MLAEKPLQMKFCLGGKTQGLKFCTHILTGQEEPTSHTSCYHVCLDSNLTKGGEPTNDKMFIQAFKIMGLEEWKPLISKVSHVFHSHQHHNGRYVVILCCYKWGVQTGFQHHKFICCHHHADSTFMTEKRSPCKSRTSLTRSTSVTVNTHLCLTFTWRQHVHFNPARTVSLLCGLVTSDLPHWHQDNKTQQKHWGDCVCF